MDTPVCRLVLTRSSITLVAWIQFGVSHQICWHFEIKQISDNPSSRGNPPPLHHCHFMLIERYFSRLQFQISYTLTHNHCGLSLPLSLLLFLFAPPPLFLLSTSLPQTVLQFNKSQWAPVNLSLCVGPFGCVTLSQPFVNTLQRINCLVFRDHTEGCKALFLITSYLSVSLDIRWF